MVARQSSTADIKVRIIAGEAKRKQAGDSLVKNYLLFFNSLQVFGWAYVVYCAAKHLLLVRSLEGLYDACPLPLLLFQSLMAGDILHSLLRLVRTGVFNVVMQLTSRLMVVWLTLYVAYEPKNSPFLVSLLFAWGITEVIRFSYLALNMENSCPYWLKYLRYTTFIVLYPIGVASEIGLMVVALPEIQSMHILEYTLPNTLNMPFRLDYLYYIAFAMYAPGFLQLYTYMLRQRSRQLAPAEKDE